MQYKKAYTKEQARQYVRELPDVVSVDTEYDDLDTKKAKLLSISVGNADTAWLFPPEFRHELEPLKRKKLIFFQNYTVDHHVLLRHGLDLTKTPFMDTMLLEHLIDENLPHGLGDMAVRYFNDNYKSEFWGKYEKFEGAPEDEANEYEKRDAIYTYRLGRKFLEALRGKDDLVEHVHRLAKALNSTEIRGVRVNTELIRKTKSEMFEEISSFLPRLRESFSDYIYLYELEAWLKVMGKLKTVGGRSKKIRPQFNFGSHDQLRWLVYEALGCPVLRRTPIKRNKKTGKKSGGNPSTDYEALEELSYQYPELKTLVEYAGAKSLYSTVEGMLDRTVDNRIYPSFPVNGTGTGRVAHKNPNLGNLPTEGVIRNFFLSDSGRAIVGADFKQLEVNVEANLTKDKNLVRILLERTSKHDITAEGLGIKRDQAKTLNFALQYGAGAGKVSKILGVSQREAEDIFRRYWELYSGVRALKEKACAELDANSFVTNIFGRTRHFPKPTDKGEKARQERQAYNFLIQGVGADLCNRATYLWHEDLERTGNGELLWSVHDEILGQVKPELAELEKQNLVNIMEGLTEYIGFEHPLKSKAYGPLTAWAKT